MTPPSLPQPPELLAPPVPPKKIRLRPLPQPGLDTILEMPEPMDEQTELDNALAFLRESVSLYLP